MTRLDDERNETIKNFRVTFINLKNTMSLFSDDTSQESKLQKLLMDLVALSDFSRRSCT